MKKLIAKLTILIFLLLILVGVVEFLSLNPATKEKIAVLTNSEDFLEGDTSDVDQVILSARADDGSKVLVLGDSIARQMFSVMGPDVPNGHIACTYAAINISGQYMIAMEYLETHPEATDIWLFAHPLTITRTYDLEQGYGYAVMPFAKEGSLRFLDDETIDKMASVYGRLAMIGTVADLISESPINKKVFFSYIRLHREEYKQSNSYEIASGLILRLRDECEARGVKLHFYSSPSTEFYREKIEETRGDYELSALYEAYPDYLDSIYYFPTEWSDDLTHFDEEHANRETYENIITGAYPESVLCYNED